METPDIYLKASDGLDLFFRIWEPSVPVIATVTAIHGIGEHISRYEHVFRVFAQNGIRVAGIDQRGHGHTLKKALGANPGDLGRNFDQVMKDHHLVFERIAIIGVPHFVFGHSLGGLLGLLYVKMYLNEVAGAVISGPAIDTLQPKVLIAISPYLSFFAG
ncbi:hypothetical protein HK096_007119, partial [Nowakowskiella sp. JEL0078]